MTINELSERQRLLDHLSRHGIEAPIVPYPAHDSIEDGKRLRGDLPGTFTKNLLLKDKKGRLFFVTAHEDTDIDLRTLHIKVHARGRLGFASTATMSERLHVSPGTATPLALFNDVDHDIVFVVDEHLRNAAQLNFHPMTHTESIGVTWPQLDTFCGSTGHDVMFVRLDTEPDDDSDNRP